MIQFKNLWFCFKKWSAIRQNLKWKKEKQIINKKLLQKLREKLAN
jgi:hypothetical protein